MTSWTFMSWSSTTLTWLFFFDRSAFASWDLWFEWSWRFLLKDFFTTTISLSMILWVYAMPKCSLSFSFFYCLSFSRSRFFATFFFLELLTPEPLGLLLAFPVPYSSKTNPSWDTLWDSRNACFLLSLASTLLSIETLRQCVCQASSNSLAWVLACSL